MQRRAVISVFFAYVLLLFSFAVPAFAARDAETDRTVSTLSSLFALSPVSGDESSSLTKRCRALHRAGDCSLGACRAFMDDWLFLERKRSARDLRSGTVRTARSVTVPHISEMTRTEDGRAVLFCLVRLEDELRHSKTGAYRSRDTRILQVRAVVKGTTVTDLAFTELRQ